MLKDLSNICELSDNFLTRSVVMSGTSDTVMFRPPSTIPQWVVTEWIACCIDILNEKRGVQEEDGEDKMEVESFRSMGLLEDTSIVSIPPFSLPLHVLQSGRLVTRAQRREGGGGVGWCRLQSGGGKGGSDPGIGMSRVRKEKSVRISGNL